MRPHRPPFSLGRLPDRRWVVVALLGIGLGIGLLWFSTQWVQAIVVGPQRVALTDTLSADARTAPGETEPDGALSPARQRDQLRGYLAMVVERAEADGEAALREMLGLDDLPEGVSPADTVQLRRIGARVEACAGEADVWVCARSGPRVIYGHGESLASARADIP